MEQTQSTVESQPQTMSFGAEAKQVLELMIHSVYSNKDIFLRELISNASDALDKRRFAALSDPSLLAGDTVLQVRIEADPSARTLTITDSGIGMSRDEVVANIGTIAKSGTREMLAKLRAEGNAQGPQLIGQFGVGFYSVFMVADRVELVTRKAGADAAVAWSSTGDGTYTLQNAERAEPGTTITLFLKPHDSADGIADYTDEHVVSDIVRKHSDFVTYPVVFGGNDKPLNSMKPIWTRSEKEVSEREYAEFYRHLTHDFGEPLKTIAFKAEGTFEYSALLFIPERAPMDLFFRDFKRGLQLYVRRVSIMEQCEELLPSYLRFVRGVVDSADLPLNVSRELLQQNRQLTAIRKRLAKKVVDTLVQMKESDAAQYAKVYAEFGPLLKEGVASDADNRERLIGLLQFASTHDPDKQVSFADYKARMKDGQDAIYVLPAESRAAAERSPHLEAYTDKGYEVLFLLEPVDELVTSHVTEFDGVKLHCITKGECDVAEKDAEAAKAHVERYEHLCAHLQRSLDSRVSEVRVSTRLRKTAVCLVSGKDDLSPHMLRILRQAQRDIPEQKRILELNPTHPQVEALLARLSHDRDDVALKQYAEVLYGQALLAEGSPLPNPAEFAELLGALVLRAETQNRRAD